MTRQRHKRPARPAPTARPAPAAPAQGVPDEGTRRVLQTLLDTEIPRQSPSMTQATAHQVDRRNYTTREMKAAEHALDFAGTSQNALTFVNGVAFPGFPVLAQLAQLSEYRAMAETLADDVIRMWGRVVSSGEADADKCQQIEAELKRIDMRAVVKTIVEHDQLYGGAHAYIKLRDDEANRELPLLLKPYSVPKGSFEGLRVVEPYWVTPNFYNSIDPTAADFYKPSSWWMLGTLTHATRLQTLISRPVPDMLKPAYSFRGVSMTQLAMPYVDNWLRTRQSVSDTVKQFSVSGVLTDLQQMLLPGAALNLAGRAQLINQLRDNRNILFLDKATEEFFQINTPLSGLDALQAQAQEQQSAVSRIPLVKLLGITPTGLNASSDGEIRVYYDRVSGYQANVLMSLMLNVIRIIQLSTFGEIDEDISWEWNELYEMTALEAADARAKDADTDTKYIEAGVIAPEDVRKRLSSDPNSLYAGVADGEDIDSIPDADIGAITDRILEIGSEPPPAAAPEGVDPAQPATIGAGLAQQEEETAAEGTMGAHASGLTLDPSPTDDPGLLKV